MAVLLVSGKNQAVDLPTFRSAMQHSTSPAMSVNLYRKTFKTTSYVSVKHNHLFLFNYSYMFRSAKTIISPPL